MKSAIFALLAVWSVCGSAGERSSPATRNATVTHIQTHDLGGSWTLRIENLQHQLIATMTVQFGGEKAASCIVGEWKRVVVTARSSSDEKFFPIAEPLSYEIIGDDLTIGRNEVCDAYLRLFGRFKGNAASGEYFSFGMLSGKRLGYFSLSKRL